VTESAPSPRRPSVLDAHGVQLDPRRCMTAAQMAVALGLAPPPRRRGAAPVARFGTELLGLLMDRRFMGGVVVGVAAMALAFHL
jgi:hypothetical protein